MLGVSEFVTTKEAPADADDDGRQVVGIDLHRRRSVIVRMTAGGEQLPVARIGNDPARLAREIAQAGSAPEVVLEVTYGWYRAAADVLQAAGARVRLAHPLGVKGFAYRRMKNARDAADLADLLRMGRLPEAWIAPPEVRELRELVRHRALCRYRHKARYAEVRVMPSSERRCWSGAVIGWSSSA
jgi:transposase